MSTHFFDPKGREQYSKVMKQAGYVEIPTFNPHLDGYSCYSCQYMRKAGRSPTGFWCEEWKFPDKPEGCCNSWRPVEGLTRHDSPNRSVTPQQARGQ